MYSTPWHKRLLRPFGIEVKRFQFGLDPWADLSELFLKKPPKVIIDAGANRGQSSRQLAALFPAAKIYAFEPNPAIFPQLQEAVRDLAAVAPFQMALGDRPETTTLKITGSPLNTSLLTYSREDGTDRVVKEVEVKVETLERFCQTHSLGSIDLLKSDVQGFDLRLFQGAGSLLTAGRIQAIFTEVLFHPIYQEQANFQEILAFLLGHGFRFCGFYDAIRERDFHIQWADALFVRPEYFAGRA